MSLKKSVFGLIVLLPAFFTFTGSGVVSAQAQISGETIVVSNTSEAINGNVSSPAALIADPGPDGISLAEAITAAEATGEYDVVQFDPSLSGSVIDIHTGLPAISQGNLTIDGNIDADTSPDITLDGAGSTGYDCFNLYGASHVVIKGLVLRNFNAHGVNINPNTASGTAFVEDITVYRNTISSASSAVQLMIWQQNHAIIRNIEIISNTLQNSAAGISVIAGMGDGAMDNQISGVSIISNTIYNPGYNIGIFISPAATGGLSRNTITDVEIRGNQISGHTNSSILLDASNQVYCNDNTLDGVVIAENVIDGPHVTIEVISESGSYSTGNTTSNITIADNVLSGGGIQFGAATGYGAHDNTISTVVIERNQISSSQANGIYLIAGSGGAYQNRFENVILRSNFIRNSTDAGILLHGDTSYSPNNTLTNVTITNQTLVNNGVGSSWAGGINVNSKHASNTITDVSVTNSILWGNGAGDALRGALVPALVAYNLLGDVRFVGSNNNVYQTPGFVDAAAGNYRLQSTSVCVDSGDPEAASLGAQDLDRKIRLGDGNTDSNAVVDRGAWEYDTITMQEMNIRGNGFSIITGDAVPVPWDGTDFGVATVSGEHVRQTYTIENTGAAPLNLTGASKVEVGGVNAADFTVVSEPGSRIDGAGTTSFTIEFTPRAAGQREATLSIANDDSDENPYTFVIRGTGKQLSNQLYLPLILH